MPVVQPNMQAQDELAAMFSRNLTLEPVPQLATVETPNEEPKIIYISQHYTHTAHVAARQDVPPPQSSPRPASEPPQLEHFTVENILRNHGVNTAGLSSAQLQLFKTVDAPEKELLIKVWKESPPTNSNDNPTLAWSMTTVEQEYALAKMRHEQREIAEQWEREMAEVAERERQQADNTVMSLDGTPLTPIQAGDGRWLPAMSNASYMEPYMSSGYEEMARREYEESARRAVYAEAMEPKVMSANHTAIGGLPTFNPAHADPVYAAHIGNVVQLRQQEAMEDQYGRMMAYRCN
ncbi:hypothetical protein B0H66DRAFT_39005 [Apodospora peruviana]|uniref:Uncharacterized protein n=1 Tax=Apodospora peruviana TaxID=516989 RepID=A0AAE0IRP8_9PEZI|nr:hypothetical protein B0H66DRAFT_39005 [Apodospora peruviana]